MITQCYCTHYTVYIIEFCLLYWEIACDAQNRGTYVCLPPSQLLEENLCHDVMIF